MVAPTGEGVNPCTTREAKKPIADRQALARSGDLFQSLLSPISARERLETLHIVSVLEMFPQGAVD